MARIYDEYWDSNSIDNTLDKIRNLSEELNLSEHELKEPQTISQAFAKFARKSNRQLLLSFLFTVLISLLNIIFLRFAPGDIIYSFSFIGILSLFLFAFSFLFLANLLKSRKVLQLMQRPWRRRIVALAMSLSIMPVASIYTLGMEYFRTLLYQKGTCLQLTGADENYYYVTGVSCLSPLAFEEIILEVKDSAECEEYQLPSFKTSVGTFCVAQRREPTKAEQEIIGDTTIADGSSA